MQLKSSLLTIRACWAVAVAGGCLLSGSKAEAQIQQIHPGESIFITQTHLDTLIHALGLDDFFYCGYTLQNNHSVITQLLDLNLRQDREYIVMFQYSGNQLPVIQTGGPGGGYCYTSI